MIVTVTMNPAVDKTAEVDDIFVGGLNRLKNVVMDAGGKGINVSKTIKALCGQSKAIAVVGGNPGQFIIDELSRLDIDCIPYMLKQPTRTNMKILNKEMVLTEFNESGPTLTLEQQLEVFKLITSSVNKDDILILSGSVSPSIPTTFYRDIIKSVKEKGVNVIVDADGDLLREALDSKPLLVKPNDVELKKLFKVEDASIEEMISMGHQLVNDETKYVIISLGSKGALCIEKERCLFAKGLSIDFQSAVGAGDAMVASLALSIQNNEDSVTMLAKAIATSAGACTTIGTSPASKDVVDELEKRVIIESRKI